MRRDGAYREAVMALNDEDEAALRGELDRTKQALKDANGEAKGHRLNADRAVKAAERAEAERDEAKAEAERQIEAIRTEATGKVTAAETARDQVATESRSRTLRAELRAAATAAGMRDPDDLGALDTSSATMSDDFKVTLPEGFFDRMREAKPYLFGEVRRTTASTAVPPPPPEGGAKKFTDMTADEQRAWKRANGIP